MRAERGHKNRQLLCAKVFVSKEYTFSESHIYDLNCIDQNIVYLNSFPTVSFSFARN